MSPHQFTYPKVTPIPSSVTQPMVPRPAPDAAAGSGTR